MNNPRNVLELVNELHRLDENNERLFNKLNLTAGAVAFSLSLNIGMIIIFVLHLWDNTP